MIVVFHLGTLNEQYALIIWGLGFIFIIAIAGITSIFITIDTNVNIIKDLLEESMGKKSINNIQERRKFIHRRNKL
jgi:hypothetical protein